MGIGQFSRQLAAVGVLGMPDVGLDTTRRAESVREETVSASVLRLLYWAWQWENSFTIAL
jgi:hypothetical protein